MANTPPPYSDVNGLYVQNDKHIDVSFAAYDGTARPGQLVVDTANYSLWVGNAAGYLNTVGGGTADTGNILFNNNNIYPNNPGYPHIYGGPFGGPELTYLTEAGNTASYSQTMYINDSGLTISLDSGNVGWNFNPDGTLTTNGTDGNITGANVVSANTFIMAGGTELGQIEGANTFGFFNSNANTQFLIELGPTLVWDFDGNYGTLASPVVSVDNLPSPTSAGLRAFVSDANLVATGNFGAVVGNLGSNTVPVYSDGANWRIG